MVTRVGVSDWSANAPSWPSGTRKGDVAVLTSVHDQALGSIVSPPGWSLAGSWSSVAWVSMVWARLDGAVWTQVVTDTSVPPWPGMRVEPGRRQVQVVVYRGTSGVGRSRQGMGEVPVQAHGGAHVVAAEVAATGAPVASLPGVTRNGTTGSAQRPAHLGQAAMWAATGWADAGGTPGTYGTTVDVSRLLALELLPPVGPAAPTIVSPATGNETSAGVDVDYAWRHNPASPGGYQDAYRLRVDRGSGWEYWSASTGNWSASDVVNVSGVEGVTVPAARHTPMAEHVWQAMTREGLDGQWSPWSDTASHRPVTAPSVNVTAPTGVVSNDLTPTVAWTATTPRGVQTAVHVRVVDADAGVLYDSGALPTPAKSLTLPVLEWVNGAPVTALVRVQQTGGSWSPWVTSAFAVSWSEPATPTVSATPRAARDGGVVVDLSGLVAGARVEVQRVSPEGLWEPVVILDAPDASVSVVDVFAPYGTPTAYRARQASVLDGVPLSSGWGMSAPVTSTDECMYLAAAQAPASSWVRVMLSTDGERTHRRPVSVAYGLGDDRARVSYGVRRGLAGSMVASTLSRLEHERLTELLESGAPLVMRWTPEYDHALGEQRTRRHVPPVTFQVAGEVTSARPLDGPFAYRAVSWPWVEHDPVVPDHWTPEWSGVPAGVYPADSYHPGGMT